MASKRKSRIQGRPPARTQGPQRPRARERIAAERAAQKRADGSCWLSGRSPRCWPSSWPWSRSSSIVFVSEESCPFCAAERWAVTVALSHFGTWSQLGVTRSAANDIFPDTATLSFRTIRYRSADLTLLTTELTDNAGHPLQAQTSLDASLIRSFDVPPYVNSADQSGAVPFLDIGNQYILAGAQYDPQVLAGLSAAQIAGQLGDPSSPVARAIDGSAQVIIAAINQVLHHHATSG